MTQLSEGFEVSDRATRATGCACMQRAEYLVMKSIRVCIYVVHTLNARRIKTAPREEWYKTHKIYKRIRRGVVVYILLLLTFIRSGRGGGPYPSLENLKKGLKRPIPRHFLQVSRSKTMHLSPSRPAGLRGAEAWTDDKQAKITTTTNATQIELTNNVRGKQNMKQTRMCMPSIRSSTQENQPRTLAYLYDYSRFPPRIGHNKHLLPRYTRPHASPS